MMLASGRVGADADDDGFEALFQDAADGGNVDWHAVVLAGELRPEQRPAFWRAAATAPPAGACILQSSEEFELLAANDKLVGEEDAKTIAKDLARSHLIRDPDLAAAAAVDGAVARPLAGTPGEQAPPVPAAVQAGLS